MSLLEYRYVHRVERPHGLPAARRQARIRQRTGNRYLDNLYEGYGVCSELDGTAAHPAEDVALYLSTLVWQDPETWGTLAELPETRAVATSS